MTKPNVVFKNEDKDCFKEPIDHKNIINWCRGYKLLIAGSPNRGKTNVLKNILLAQKPVYDKIIVCHLDKNTKEYSDIECELIDSPLDIDLEALSDTSVKTAIIFEDVDFTSFNKREKDVILRVFRYYSSHCGVNVHIISQTYFNGVPVQLRRLIDILIFYKTDDKTTIKAIASRYDLNKETIEYIIAKKIKTRYDNICIDNLGYYPKIRVNLTEVID
jgi:hypothetical protein